MDMYLSANNWRVIHGLIDDSTEDFLLASKCNNDGDISIMVRNVWEIQTLGLSEWPNSYIIRNKYLEIEQDMMPLFARELEQLGENMSTEAMRRFFNGRYSAGVDYISIEDSREDADWPNDTVTSIIIYISDPHQFICEMKRLQGLPLLKYSAADMLEFLSAGESEVDA